LLWLLAARKKKLLRPLRLLLKHLLLLPPTQLLPRPLPTQPSLLRLLTLLLPLRLLLRPLLTLLLLLRPLLRKLLTLLQPSNQLRAEEKTGLRAGFFSSLLLCATGGRGPILDSREGGNPMPTQTFSA
jgi:hypothetical protein